MYSLRWISPLQSFRDDHYQSRTIAHAIDRVSDTAAEISLHDTGNKFVPRRVAVITRLSISFCVSRRGSILIMPIHDGQMSGSSLTSSFLTGYPYALPAPNCRALPPGEFNGTIPELLLFVLKVSWRQLKPFLLMLQPTMLQTRLKSYKRGDQRQYLASWCLNEVMIGEGGLKFNNISGVPRPPISSQKQ